MIQIFDSLKTLISPELIAKVATSIEEPESKVTNSVSSIFAGLLGIMLKKGTTTQMDHILQEARNLNILPNINNLLGKGPTQEQQEIGDKFLQHILGDKAAAFTESISHKTDISKVATNKLVSVLSPVILGFLGSKLEGDNFNLVTLFKHIENEKNDFLHLVPSTLKDSFGLYPLTHSTFSEEKNEVNSKIQPVKKNWNWIYWLIPFLLLLLLFFWWRSCNEANAGKCCAEENVIVTDVQPADVTTIVVDEVVTELALPDGVKLNALVGGIEDQIINFLKSDAYKNATNESLKDKWFEFDKIDFEFGSATKLQRGQEQINNIIAILKNFKDVKIEIAANTDKKGSEEANMKLSKDRAATIAKMLGEGGVASQIVKTDGFGEIYAKHSENESDNAREEDRDIALRFVK